MEPSQLKRDFDPHLMLSELCQKLLEDPSNKNSLLMLRTLLTWHKNSYQFCDVLRIAEPTLLRLLHYPKIAFNLLHWRGPQGQTLRLYEPSMMQQLRNIPMPRGKDFVTWAKKQLPADQYQRIFYQPKTLALQAHEDEQLRKIQRRTMNRLASRKIAALLEQFGATSEPFTTEYFDVIPEASSFFACIERIRFHLSHTINTASQYPSVMKSGAIESYLRLQQIHHRAPDGLTHDGDLRYHSVYWCYFNLQLASFHYVPDKPEILIDLKRFVAARPLEAEGLLFKGHDWGGDIELTTQTIPGSEAMITQRLSTYGKSVTYHYHDPRHRIIYTIPASTETYIGKDYPRFLSGLMNEHLKRLPPDAQACLLRPFFTARSEKDKQRIAEEIFNVFYSIEVSLPGKLDLDIAYVDTLYVPNQEKHLIGLPIQLLRAAVEEPHARQFQLMFENYPLLHYYPWVKDTLRRMIGRKLTHIAQLVDIMNTEPEIPEQKRRSKHKQHVAYQAMTGLLIDNPGGLLAGYHQQYKALTEHYVSPHAVNRLVRILKHTHQDNIIRMLNICKEQVLTIYGHIGARADIMDDTSTVGFMTCLAELVFKDRIIHNLLQTKHYCVKFLMLAAVEPTHPALDPTLAHLLQTPLFETTNHYSKRQFIAKMDGLSIIQEGNPNPVKQNRSFLADILTGFSPPRIISPFNGNSDDLVPAFPGRP